MFLCSEDGIKEKVLMGNITTLSYTSPPGADTAGRGFIAGGVTRFDGGWLAKLVTATPSGRHSL